MTRQRVTEESAWLALAWLCKDLDVPMLDCPAHIVEKHIDFWRQHGVRCELHGTQAGLAIYGMSVVYYKAAVGGYRSGGGYWHDGLYALAGDTWRELVGRIGAAREGVELARKGPPWKRAD